MFMRHVRSKKLIVPISIHLFKIIHPIHKLFLSNPFCIQIIQSSLITDIRRFYSERQSPLFNLLRHIYSFFGIHPIQIIITRPQTNSHITRIMHCWLSIFTLFCRNHNHTISRFHPIYSRG